MNGLVVDKINEFRATLKDLKRSVEYRRFALRFLNLIEDLPSESLPELVRFIEFLRFRGRQETKAPVADAEAPLMAIIHRRHDVHQQIPAYARLGQLFEVLSNWQIVPFDEPAANHFESLRRRRIRIGTMDLKIASIAVVNDALLVSVNERDYFVVPNLRCENWLKP